MAGKASTTSKSGKNRPSGYLTLIRELELRPIRSEADLDRAIAVLDALSDRETLSPDEHDDFLVLSGLVEKYEDEHHAIPVVTGVPMLRYLIESSGAPQARVAAEAGIAESTLSEILAGERKLGIRYTPALAAYFRVDTGLFIPGAPQERGRS
jgi:HTH-type transcriptional regulator/antitoxin HigA